VFGGVSVKQFIDATKQDDVLIARADCPVLDNKVLGDINDTFCFLSDVSVRQGNSIQWNICRIEVRAMKLILVAETEKSTCTRGSEIACQLSFAEARRIKWTRYYAYLLETPPRWRVKRQIRPNRPNRGGRHGSDWQENPRNPNCHLSFPRLADCTRSVNYSRR
jgi:hypothetical protein